jgi:hypothetical protein
MPRYSAMCVTTNAGTAARPLMSLAAAAAGSGSVVEIAISNTTATACQFRIARLTAAGTPGTALTESKYSEPGGTPAPQCQAANSHSADATIDADSLDGCQLGAAVGAGWIFTFGGGGIQIPIGTANGLGIVPVGTGQILVAKITWDE